MADDDDAMDETLDSATDSATDAPPDPDLDVEAEPIDPESLIWVDSVTLYPDPVEAARRRYGKGGSMLAAGMFGLDQALTGKVKPDDMVQVQEAPTEPIDLDKDGFQLAIDDSTSVEAPALERRPPIGLGKKKARR